MTREEAILWLNEELRTWENECQSKHPIKEALYMACKALEQEPNTWSLDDAREDFMHDVYNTLDFLPTNEEANRIIDSFDRVTSSIEQAPRVQDSTTKNDIRYNRVEDELNRVKDELEPTTKNNLRVDAISRQAVDRLVWEYLRKPTDENIAFYEHFLELPPVTPQEPKTGHWIVNKWGNISCSECGCNALYDKVYTDNSPSGKAIRIKSTFCPTCGADMKEVKNGNE